MGEMWYLAVDTQLFIISPLLVYFLWKWRRIGPVLNGLVMIACLASTVAVYIVFDMPPSSMLTRP